MICPACRAENDDAADMCFTCGRGLSGVTQGVVIASRYEIRKPLGKGGMGMVYLAHDRQLDDMVALKLLRSDVSQASDLARRFRSEIKLARRIRHPNVCAIHEYGQTGPRQFIVMEYIEGTNLRQELGARGRFPAEEAYDLAIQLAEGLQAVHAAGVIHRDLKTSNVMRDSRGQVRLMDFGIAKASGPGNTTLTASGQVVGTPEYMSPEQCRGEKVDCRSDVYALGIVVFELFTGEVPFRGDTPVATIFKHLQEPPPLDAEAARLPAPLVPVLRKALAKAPEDRYASAREVAEALREARSLPAAQRTFAPALGPVTASDVSAVPRPTVPMATPLPAAAPPAVAAVPPVPRSAPGPRPLLAAAARPPKAAPAPARTSGAPAPAGAGWAWAGLAMGVAILVPVLLLALRSRVPPDLATATTSPGPGPSPAGAFGGGPAPAAATPGESPEGARAALPRPAALSSLAPPRPTRAPSPTRAAVVAPVRPSVAEASPVRHAVVSTPSPALAPGALRVVVTPWAEVEVDGQSVGVSPPLKPVPLSPGTHVVRLLHPDYAPFRRKVTAAPGETVTLQVDLSREAFPK